MPETSELSKMKTVRTLGSGLHTIKLGSLEAFAVLVKFRNSSLAVWEAAEYRKRGFEISSLFKGLSLLPVAVSFELSGMLLT